MIILDTNFVLIPFECGVDVFAEIARIAHGHKIAIMAQTLTELDTLQEKHKQAAKQLVEAKQLETIDMGISFVDAAIVAYCKNNPETIVATQDQELKNQLKQMGIKRIILRNKTHLELQD